MIQFTILKSFPSPELRSEYVEGMTYTVKDQVIDGETVAAVDTVLYAELQKWLADGRARLGGADTSPDKVKVSGKGEVSDPKSGAAGVALSIMWAMIFCACAALSLFDAGIAGAIAGAVTHPTATRNALADLVVDSIDTAGSPSLPGKIVMQTSGAVTVATLIFSDPAFGNSAAGVATANPITSDTNAVGGTIAKAELQNNAGTARVLCSVTATGGGGDIQLNSVIVSAGQTVALSSLTYTAPA